MRQPTTRKKRYSRAYRSHHQTAFWLKGSSFYEKEDVNIKTTKEFLGRCGRSLRLSFALAAATFIAAPAADARIVRLEILSVQSPTFGGMSFGTVGTYEKIFARAYAEVDPSDRRNALITDINLAPRNANGMVEYSADVHIIKPVDMSK